MGKIKGELEEPQTQWGQPQDVHSITFNYSSAGVGKLGPLGQIQAAYGLFSQTKFYWNTAVPIHFHNCLWLISPNRGGFE